MDNFFGALMEIIGLFVAGFLVLGIGLIMFYGLVCLAEAVFYAVCPTCFCDPIVLIVTA